MDRLRVLAITNLFPTNVDPGYAPFNRQQFAALAQQCELDVLGVVPARFGRFYGGKSSKGVVREEIIDNVLVKHPRFLSIPGLPSLNAGFLAASLLPAMLLRKKRYDVLLAAYAYPDGCAGIALGRLFGLPVVVKCHGSDLNRVVNDPPARFQLEKLLPLAERVVVVSAKLGEKAVELGVQKDRLAVVYNGVDRERFFVRDRDEARAKHGLPKDRELIVSIGHLAEHKGTRDLLEAAKRLKALRPEALVAFVGDGPLMREVSETPGVLAVGRVSHAEVAEWISAGDVLCLPSWDEGMPNVVREAHASGRPVVATAVGGVPEAVHRPELGKLVPARDPQALAEALARQLAEPRVAAETIVELGIVPTWRESARALLEVLESARGQESASS
jgi:glycosyltransferase involved in cell wall biosynthesis